MELPRKLRRVVTLAESNEHYPKFRLGAILYKGGSTLSTGMSRILTEPRLVEEGSGLLRRISVHAEIDALRQCGDPVGSTIYVARIGRNGQVGLSKPCSQCEDELTRAGVKKVIYTINDREYGVLYLRNKERNRSNG